MEQVGIDVFIKHEIDRLQLDGSQAHYFRMGAESMYRREYSESFKKDPMQFIRRLLDIGYTDNMINDIIKSF